MLLKRMKIETKKTKFLQTFYVMLHRVIVIDTVFV